VGVEEGLLWIWKWDGRCWRSWWCERDSRAEVNASIAEKCSGKFGIWVWIESGCVSPRLPAMEFFEILLAHEKARQCHNLGERERERESVSNLQKYDWEKHASIIMSFDREKQI